MSGIGFIDVILNDSKVHEKKNCPLKSLFTVLFLLFSFVPAWSVVAEVRVPFTENSQRPKIGLVLGGGGAKGAAHIGVLRVLEEQKIPVDYIAGTSMGAIVGALYASGLTAAELEDVMTTIDWNDVFSGGPDRRDIDFRRKWEDYQVLSKLSLGLKNGKVVMPRGLIQDQKVNVLFETLLLHTSEINDFDNLPIPFRAIAADLETGEKVVISSGRLADAARASMSVPGAFPPVELDGRLLIDGGILQNLPVDIVREMGAEIIICVDVDKPLPTRKELGDSFSILNQMLSIMIKKNVEQQTKILGPRDVYINPKLGVFGSTDFDKAEEIARIGEQAARENIDNLKRYSVSDGDYAAFMEQHHREQIREVKISSVKIEVEGETNIPSEIVQSRLSIKEGDTVDLAKLKHEANILYGMGDFERVDLNVKKLQDGYELLVKAREKSWGPNYLRFGFALESDFEGLSRYDLLFDYTRRWMNDFGAEWKTQVNLGSPTSIYSEFYQPLTAKRFLFVSPYASWRQELIDIYDGRRSVASYGVTSYVGGIDIGIQPWKYGESTLGLQFTRLRASPATGSIELPVEHITRGAIVFRGLLDQIDAVNFPEKGFLTLINSLSSLKSLGSDEDYNNVEGAILGSVTVMKQTVLATFAAGSHLGNDLPFYDQFSLGGFINLSGLDLNQISGQSMAIGKIITYRKVGESFIGDLYLGGSIESGNVWEAEEKQFDRSDLRYAGSLFLAYDTIIGPLYLAFGHADEGFNAAYFFIGRPF